MNIINYLKYIKKIVGCPEWVRTLYKLSNESKNGFILDGYPRTLKQSEFLDNFLIKTSNKINFIFDIKINFSTLKDRILKRSSEESRDDDKVEIIETRYNEYINSTQSVSEFYKENYSKIFFEIDGSLQIDEITQKIRKILKISWKSANF